MNKQFHAMMFAKEAHKNQTRRYTGDPYAIHLAEVAAYASAFGLDEDCVSAAWLHDCIEDQGVSSSVILDRFGSKVAGIVLDLTDPPSTENRAARKAMARQRLGLASEETQTIKVGDVLSNTASIVLHDPKFARVYLGECLQLVAALDKIPDQIRGLVESSLRENLSKLSIGFKSKEPSF